MQRGKIFRKGSSWHLRYKTYRIVDGKKLWQTTSTKLADVDQQHRTQQSVEEEAERFLKGLNPAKSVVGVATAPTFKEQALIWLERCENRQRKPIKPATLRNWKSYLKVHIYPVLQNVLLPDITNQAVKNFVAGVTRSPKTIDNIVQVIKQVKASAVNEHGDEIYPTKWNHDFMDMPRISAREQRRPSFTGDQVTAIVKAAPRRFQMLAILFAATGLRAGELFGLEVKHFDGRAVKVEQEVWHGIIQAPKTENAHRTVELDPRVAELLRAFIGVRTEGFIFRNGGGKPIHQSNFLRREFHPLLRSLKIPGCGYHAFRRFRNTYLRNAAHCPPGLLMYWLGHADRSMSDRYDKVGEGANAAFRVKQAKGMGVGFELPKRLKDEDINPRKGTVRIA